MGKKMQTLDALVSMCLERDGKGKDFYLFNNKEVKEISKKTKFANHNDATHLDHYQLLSPKMIENNFCLFHVGTRPGEKTANHAFVSPYTLAYHELEPINEESVFDLKDMKPGPLDETNTSEANILSVVHNHGILRRFLYGGDLQATPQIYMPHRSQKNTLHKIGDLSLPLGRIQFEVDMTFAYNGLVTVFEGKNWRKDRNNFAIYQLYMPFRYYEMMSKENSEIGIKEINCCYLIRKKEKWGSKIYAYLYTFQDPTDLRSIKFIKNAQYNLIYRGRNFSSLMQEKLL
ncbi:hypothetical protein OAK07_01580 [Marine Group III euryarchaeote]|nr:hypothetical protein [Marine Group III euryarchaeote]